MGKILNKIASYGWGVLAFAVFMALGGVAMIIGRDKVDTVILFIGVLCCALSIFGAAVTLTHKERGFSFAFRIIEEILGLLCGIYFTFWAKDAFNYISVFFGLFIVIDASFKFHTATLFSSYNSVRWWALIVFAVACIAGGFMLIRGYNFLDTKVFLGICMIGDGILNFCASFVSTDKTFKEKEEEKLLEKQTEKHNPNVK